MPYIRVQVTATLEPDAVADVSPTGTAAAARPDRLALSLTIHDEAGYVQLLRGGQVVGYVSKSAAVSELVRAIEVVAAGGTCPAVAAPAADAPAGPSAVEWAAVVLSDREAAVVKQIALGYSNKEIAARLGLSVKTVETYKARSLEKLGVRTRVGLVRFAADRGWMTV